MTKGVDMTEQTDSVESDEMADGVEVTTCEELAEGTGSVEGAGVTDGELGPDQGIPELIIKDRKVIIYSDIRLSKQMSYATHRRCSLLLFLMIVSENWKQGHLYVKQLIRMIFFLSYPFS